MPTASSSTPERVESSPTSSRVKEASTYDDPILFQEYALPGVSRTFALTIPELPEKLRVVVSNQYLLCRIADTIEDDLELTPEEKDHYGLEFSKAVAGDSNSAKSMNELVARLSPKTSPAEIELVANTEKVLAITRTFSENQQNSLSRCVRIMSEGMRRYQKKASLEGLRCVKDLEKYCYHVAGVVGETLTDLFCEYSPRIAAKRHILEKYAVSFGQGLQMTNILKDFWDDRSRGVCWLPRDVFPIKTSPFKDLTPVSNPDVFSSGLTRLIGIAHGHLRHAARFTHSIPNSEPGIRRFCLWAVGMAVLTLRKVHGNPEFTSGDQVKISRRSVKATVALSNIAIRNNALISLLFFTASIGLPTEKVACGSSTA